MKFLITGHTSGVGQALYNRFGGVGLSRSTGFDISKDDIHPYLDGCDIFVNNAHCYDDIFAQTRLVYKASHKRQIVIGSMASDVARVRAGGAQMYSTAKSALEVACHQLYNDGSDITLVKPSYVKNPVDVVEVVEWILLQDFSVKEISFTPK